MTEPAAPVPAPLEGQASEASDSPLGDGGKKALDAERRAKAAEKKRADALEAQLKEIQDRDLSELDKARKAQADALAELAAARTETTRYRIATKFGLKDEDAQFLVGSDEETMTALAQRLQAGYAAQNAADASAPGPASPRPDLSQGARAAMALNGDPLLASLIDKVGARPHR